MKILAVYPYVPWPLNRGAYHRAFHLLKGLARDHSVNLLALAENGEGAEHEHVFAEFCQQVDVLPFKHPAWEKLFPKRLLNPLPSTIAHWNLPSVRRRIQAMLTENRYDAVHLLDLVLAQFVVDDRVGVPVVLDRTRVDLQYQLMEHQRMSFSFKNRLLNFENYLKLWNFERRAARRCALQVVCGPDDQDFVRKFISRRVPIEVIPNGVDLEYFQAARCRAARAPEPTVVFCGAMDYNPNVDALRWYFSEIHEGLLRAVPGLKVLIVGKDPILEVQRYGERPGVTVTGGVPDVRPYYKQAWLQIVPLRIGGGTRLKIVESLGMGTAVVSTRIGAQGLDLRDGIDVLYADTAAEFIAKTARALRDSDLRATLEQNGLDSVRARLSWGKLGGDLSGAYAKHISGSRPAAAERAALAAEPALN